MCSSFWRFAPFVYATHIENNATRLSSVIAKNNARCYSERMTKDLTPMYADCLRVIDAVAKGERQTAALNRLGIDRIAFYQTLAESSELQSKMALARESMAHTLVDESLEIADVDIDAARARNRIGARHWIAARFARKTFGDKVDISVEGQVSITAALEAAQQRVRLGRDPGTIDGAQLIDVTPEMPIASADTITAAPIDPFG
jgi:hypothetical protein